MRQNKTAAADVFRQFAWNLAETLAATRRMLPKPPRTLPAGKR
ncbi:MAG TPA: hypothetical protein VG757_13510 [Devosia sp.]|nr:hypothetical protein [Devosia sp.]